MLSFDKYGLNQNLLKSIKTWKLKIHVQDLEQD